jgi:hypothetical protein
MLSENEDNIARISAVVWLAMPANHQREFLHGAKENYRLDVSSGSEALAALYPDARARQTPIGKAHAKFMDEVWHYATDSAIATKCESFAELDYDAFWSLIDMVVISMIVANVQAKQIFGGIEQQFVEAVVAARRLLHAGELLEEIGQHTEQALRALRRTDAPPPELAAANTNIQDTSVASAAVSTALFDEMVDSMPVLTLGQVKALLAVLRQKDVGQAVSFILKAVPQLMANGRTVTHSVDAVPRQVDCPRCGQNCFMPGMTGAPGLYAGDEYQLICGGCSRWYKVRWRANDHAFDVWSDDDQEQPQ